MASEPTFVIVDPPRSIFRRKRFLLPFGISAVTAVASAIAVFASGAVAMPFTALLEALMASKVEYFNDPQVKRILMETAQRLPNEPIERQGWGAVSPAHAVAYALSLRG